LPPLVFLAWGPGPAQPTSAARAARAPFAGISGMLVRFGTVSRATQPLILEPIPLIHTTRALYMESPTTRDDQEGDNSNGKSWKDAGNTKCNSTAGDGGAHTNQVQFRSTRTGAQDGTRSMQHAAAACTGQGARRPVAGHCQGHPEVWTGLAYCWSSGPIRRPELTFLKVALPRAPSLAGAVAWNVKPRMPLILEPLVQRQCSDGK